MSINSLIISYRYFLLLLLLIMVSCVREGMTECPIEESLIYIEVSTKVSGEMIADEVSDISLFLFDPDGCFYKRINVPINQIIQGIPIVINDHDITNYYVSAWANIDDNTIVSEMMDGCLLKDQSITLSEDEFGYGSTPSDLFFGFKQLKFVKSESDNVIVFKEDILLSRINARVHITARGLSPGNNDDYYFLIEAKNYGYDLWGKPISKDTRYKQNGIFDLNNSDYLTPEAFNMIHTTNDDQCITINLYKKGLTRIGSDVLIASATADRDGRLFSLNAGETANILINIDNNGEISFSMKVTSWDDTYMWTQW